MGIKQDMDILRARFETSWQALHPTIRYLLDNDVPPDPPIAPGETFVRFIIKPASMSAASLGQLAVDQTGMIMAQVCVPAATGIGPASALADDAAGMFQNWRSADQSVRVTSFQLTSRAPTKDDPYYLMTVSGSYQSNRRS